MRFLAGHLAKSLLGAGFPYGTLLVNTLGSFLIAIVFVRLSHAEWSQFRLHPPLAIGLLGAFTTFSAFSLETVTLAGDGEWGKAVLNVAANLVLCLGACAAGLAVAR